MIINSCPKCRSLRAAPIIYCHPGEGGELIPEWEAIGAISGGCSVGDDDPAWKCMVCGNTWGTKRQLEIESISTRNQITNYRAIKAEEALSRLERTVLPSNQWRAIIAGGTSVERDSLAGQLMLRYFLSGKSVLILNLEINNRTYSNICRNLGGIFLDDPIRCFKFNSRHKPSVDIKAIKDIFEMEHRNHRIMMLDAAIINYDIALNSLAIDLIKMLLKLCVSYDIFLVINGINKVNASTTACVSDSDYYPLNNGLFILDSPYTDYISSISQGCVVKLLYVACYPIINFGLVNYKTLHDDEIVVCEKNQSLIRMANNLNTNQYIFTNGLRTGSNGCSHDCGVSSGELVMHPELEKYFI